jgi:2,4-dienoyl-CoA reductase-like NADH-dependent reductase (Old Yellow Enzyme family)
MKRSGIMKVFEESSIAGVRLKNRFIRSATHEGMGDAQGRPLPELTGLYTKLAESNVGAVMTGYVSIQKNGKTTVNMRMFDDDRYIEEYRNLNNAMDELDTPLFLQLAHGGGLTASFITGEKAVSPSPFYSLSYRKRSRQLDNREIEEIIENFVKAIERAKRCGFSGVQLHAAHGYLLNEFLSPAINKRNDKWGGSIENRFRIVAEIMAKTRHQVGDYPILVKLSAYDGDKGGMRIDDSLRFAELFQKAGCDALEVSCGGVTDGFNAIRTGALPTEALVELIAWNQSLPALTKAMIKKISPLLVKRHAPLHNYNVEAAAAIKKCVDIPIIVVGGIRKLADAEDIIEKKKADFVAMCRPFIIEPNLVNKFKSGEQSQSRCIDCAYCLMGVSGKPLHCYYGKLNPKTG